MEINDFLDLQFPLKPRQGGGQQPDVCSTVSTSRFHPWTNRLCSGNPPTAWTHPSQFTLFRHTHTCTLIAYRETYAANILQTPDPAVWDFFECFNTITAYTPLLCAISAACKQLCEAAHSNTLNYSYTRSMLR